MAWERTPLSCANRIQSSNANAGSRGSDNSSLYVQMHRVSVLKLCAGMFDRQSYWLSASCGRQIPYLEDRTILRTSFQSSLVSPHLLNLRTPRYPAWRVYASTGTVVPVSITDHAAVV